jgi:SPP1 gp7 family putative phage head morphogenesis protein
MAKAEVVIDEAAETLGVSFKYAFAEFTGDLLSFVRDQDATDTAKLLSPGIDESPARSALREISNWVTKPVFSQEDGTKVKGKIYNKGQRIRGPISPSLESYVSESHDLSKVEWVTILDKRTGDLDRALDGKIFDANDPSNPLPPLHPNCRCTMQPITDIPDEKAHNQSFLR